MTNKTIINPESLAKPSGFSHGIVTSGGRMLFLAGQPGVDLMGTLVSPDDLVAQFKQAIANIKTVVEAAGGSVTDIVQMTIYVVEVDDYKDKLKPLGLVYREVFGKYFPAVTLVGVLELFDENALVEIQCIAVIA